MCLRCVYLLGLIYLCLQRLNKWYETKQNNKCLLNILKLNDGSFGN